MTRKYVKFIYARAYELSAEYNADLLRPDMELLRYTEKAAHAYQNALQDIQSLFGIDAHLTMAGW